MVCPFIILAEFLWNRGFNFDEIQFADVSFYGLCFLVSCPRALCRGLGPRSFLLCNLLKVSEFYIEICEAFRVNFCVKCEV